jgi:serine/threonine-protein kinase
VYGVRVGGGAAAPALRPRRRRYAIVAVLAMVAASLSAVVIVRYFGEPPPGQDAPEPRSFTGRKLSISLSDEALLSFVGSAPLGVGRTALDLSPNGRLLVYAGERSGGGTQLYLRSLDRFEVRPLRGTEGAYAPFFSPDSRWIGFFSEDQLKKVSVLGGNPVALADATNPSAGAWWTDDRILFATNEGARLFWVAASGGASRKFDFEGGKRAAGIWSRIEVLPDGRHFLFSTVWNGMFAYSFESGEAVRFAQAGTNPRYVADGRLLFTRGSDLMAVAFDPDDLVFLSEPALVADGVRVEGFGHAQFSVDGEGTVAYAPGAPAMEGSLSIVDRDGQVQRLPFPEGIFSPPAFSPDGGLFAAGVLEVTWDVWIFDLERGARRRLTRDGNNQAPVWSGDGERIFFMSDRGESGGYDIYSVPAHGAERPAAVIEDASDLLFPSVSEDGTLLIVKVGPGLSDLSLLSPDREVKKSLMPMVAQPGVSETLARISADGEWAAYTADETGRYEVYVAPTSGKQSRVQISIEGGEEPVWSPSGDRIFFRNGTTLMVAPIEMEGSTLRAGSPTPLFDDPAWVNLIGHSYDVAPDGRGFLLVRSEQKRTTSEIRVIEASRAAREYDPSVTQR